MWEELDEKKRLKRSIYVMVSAEVTHVHLDDARCYIVVWLRGVRFIYDYAEDEGEIQILVSGTPVIKLTKDEELNALLDIMEELINVYNEAKELVDRLREEGFQAELRG